MNLKDMIIGQTKKTRGHVPVSKATLATVKRIVDAAQGIKKPIGAGNWKGAKSKIAALEKATTALKKDLEREEKNREAGLKKSKQAPKIKG